MRHTIPEEITLKHAVIGIRAHSGWAAAIAVGSGLNAPEILDRRRISVVDTHARAAKQPYHFARELPLRDAETYLASCAKTARELAGRELMRMLDGVSGRGYSVVGCAILASSGRALPGLEAILASHPLIHTAEGEFFRNAFADACADMGIPVTRIRERELVESAVSGLRIPAAKIGKQLTNMGREIGPPWTQDQKNAALAGWILLYGGPRSPK